jgi:shikimate 5-dehydrogenase
VNKFFPTTGTFNKSCDIYIWGSPLDYTLSIFFQEHAIALRGKRAIYRPFRGKADDFATLLSKDNCAGANITNPFKTVASEICDEITETALKAGSVNTVFKRSSKLIGESTDGQGLYLWMKKYKLLSPAIQIAGNGGSARSIASYFYDKEIKVDIFGRSLKGWETDFGRFRPLEELSPQVSTINTTPLPIQGGDMINISYQLGSVNIPACGMLAYQGAISAEKWLKQKISCENFFKLTLLHAKAHSNLFLINHLESKTL